MISSGYDFDTRIDRSGTNCEKWDDIESVFGKEGLMPFWVADMDFKSAPEIVDTLRQKLEFGVFGYPTEQIGKYQAVVANWESKRHGWKISPDDVGFMPGVITGLSVAICEFTEPGDGIVIQPPIYPPFFREIRHNGRTVVENPLMETENGYAMDLDNLREALKPGVSALILCSPHNPVSRVWGLQELAELGQICLERGVTVICDEIHQDIVFSDAKHIPLSLACPKLDEKLVTFISPSKTFNLAGLRASAWIARDKKIADRMRRALNRFHLSGLNMFGLAALEAAYTKGEAWLDAALAYLEKNRGLVERFIREKMPRVKLRHPEGTYIFWLDFRDYGLKNPELMDILINKAGVALNDGASFGEGGKGFVRLNVGCPRTQLEDGLKRIAEAFGNLEGNRS
ncbi:MAG: pyridoxal phosphate-dependent aminotransferase [Synergistaceae bacterium]|nr:pyridoxal phosphate-dependent aminotransferase [Synergistaceae bacterium]